MKTCIKIIMSVVILLAGQVALAGIVTKDYRQVQFASALKEVESWMSWHSANMNINQYVIRYIGVDQSGSAACGIDSYQEIIINDAYEIAGVANSLPIGEVRLEMVGESANGIVKQWLVLLNREIDAQPVRAFTYKDYSTLAYSAARDQLVDNLLGWYEANRTIDHYNLTYVDPVSGSSQVVSASTNTDFKLVLDGLAAGNYEFKVDVVIAGGNTLTRFVAMNKLPGDVVPTSVDLLLSWNQPTQREDGTAIDVQDIAGYEVYMTKIDANNNATDQILAVADAAQTSLTVPGLTSGQYHLAISAIDSGGLKSQLSSVVTYTVN